MDITKKILYISGPKIKGHFIYLFIYLGKPVKQTPLRKHASIFVLHGVVGVVSYSALHLVLTLVAGNSDLFVFVAGYSVSCGLGFSGQLVIQKIVRLVFVQFFKPCGCSGLLLSLIATEFHRFLTLIPGPSIQLYRKLIIALRM